jgi:hypothetical protein
VTRCEALLRRASWQAEKICRQRGDFTTVLWLTETADGRRERFETGCDAPIEISDAAALDALVDELRSDFARDKVVRFGIAYAGFALTISGTLRSAPARSRSDCIVIEAHSALEHVQSYREVFAGALGTLNPIRPVADSRFDALVFPLEARAVA